MANTTQECETMTDAVQETERDMSWEKAAIKQQQFYFEVFGDCDWEGYKCSEMELLERKVGFALYGLPEEVPDDNENCNLGYDKRKVEIIQKISSCIKKHCESDTDEYSVLLAFIFVILNNNDQMVPVPVFKVPKYVKGKECAVFIDSDCRVYKDWNDYLSFNNLPACTYCYPNDGVYLGDTDDNVYVQFGKTPACKTSKKVLKYLDHSATAVAVGGTLIGIASLTALPVAAPLLLASTVGNVASFLYGTGRSIETLVDKKTHSQDIGLKDSEARSCYLSMVGGALSVAAGAGVKVVSHITKSGEVVGKTGRVIVNALNVSSLVANGAGIVNNIFLMKEHWQCGNLTPLEVFQFSSSVLFFTHSLVNIKMADTIIRETQANVLTEFESSLRSNRHRKVFRRLARETAPGQDTVTRNAKVIKAVSHIHNRDDYFASVVKVRRDIHESRANIAFSEQGLVEVNGVVQVNPIEFHGLNVDQRKMILQATKDSTTNFSFMTNMQDLENVTQQTSSVKYNVNDIISDSQEKHVFKTLLKELKLDFGSLCRAMGKVDLRFCDKILSISLIIAEKLELKGACHILRITQFICHLIQDIATKMDFKYKKCLEDAKMKFGDSFDQNTFDRNYAISEERLNHFVSAILANWSKIPQLMEKFKNAYKDFTSSNSSASSNNSVRNSSSTSENSASSSLDFIEPKKANIEKYQDFAKSSKANTENNQDHPRYCVGSLSDYKTDGNEPCPVNVEQCETTPELGSVESQFQYLEYFDFTNGSLTYKEVFAIVYKITGFTLCEDDCMIIEDDSVISVSVTNENVPLNYVMIVRFLEHNMVGANAFYFEN